jgi:hypothetical protein
VDAGEKPTLLWGETDSTSRSPVSCDTPQRPLITSPAIIFSKIRLALAFKTSTPSRLRVADDVLSKGETDIQDIAEEIETGATKDPACRMATAESLALHFLRQYR